MNFVKPKKGLGQHFLKDNNIAEKIVDSLTFNNYTNVLEIGPGMGVLTKFLLPKENIKFKAVEIDRESVAYLKDNLNIVHENIIQSDFLKLNLNEVFDNNYAIIGNFPYNISSQILFHVLDYNQKIPEVVGMFQKEVALRLASKPNCKAYGILAILLQCYYDIEYLFTVNETVFFPPPKVKSGVIRLIRKKDFVADYDEVLFKTIVKTAFNQRRKTLRNALKPLNKDLSSVSENILNKRAEQLFISDFVDLTKLLG